MKIDVPYGQEPPNFAVQSSNLRWEMKFDFPSNESLIYEIITSEHWPVAIADGDIIKTDWDKRLRARTICNNLLPSLSGLSLLSVGDCPYIVDNANKYTTKADHIGVNAILQSDLKDKYDIILLYDIIDHISDNKRVRLLNVVKQNLEQNGCIVCRCHPWLSIHGGHCYDRLNKAYAHLFLGDKLKDYQSIAVDKIQEPLTYYDDLYSKLGLKTVDATRYSIEIPDTINQDDIVEYLANKYRLTPPIMRKSMATTFIDYKLKPI
jgi:hypothetical protein